MVVLKQLEAEPELVHCHVTLTVEVLMISAVTSVGVGGAGGDTVVQNYNCCKKGYITNAHLLLADKLLWSHLCYHLDHV